MSDPREPVTAAVPAVAGGGIPPSGHPPAPGLEREEPRQWQEDDIPAPPPDPDPVPLSLPEGGPPQPPAQSPPPSSPSRP